MRRLVPALLAVLALLLLTGAAGAPAAAATRGVVVTPAQVAAGGSAQVRGTGFAFGPVDVRLDGRTVGRAFAEFGRFAVDVAVPATTSPGRHRLVAVQSSGRAWATLRVVRPQAPSRSTSSPGSVTG